MKKKLSILSLVVLLITPALLWADDDDDERVYGFDSLVHELTSSRTNTSAHDTTDPFDLVRIHFGIGLVTSYLSYETNFGPVSGTHQGFQASLGIDLFSPNWIAEGVVRSFSETEIDKTRASLHEFDIKIIYEFTPRSTLVPFLGAGMAARYLDVTEKTTTKYTTPASIVFLGTSYAISENLNLAGEVSYRRPFVDETPERAAADFTFRLDTHF